MPASLERPKPAVLLAVAAAYFIAAKIGLKLAFVHVSATAVWPPSGIAVAAYLILGPKAWPGVFAGAFLANITTAGSIYTSLGIAAGNTLEGLLAMHLLQRFAKGGASLFDAREIPKFVLLAAMAGPLVSAFMGVASLALGGYAPWTSAGSIALTWWLGDAIGILVFTPAILLWKDGPDAARNRGQGLEIGLLILTALLSAVVLFTGTFPPGARNYPLTFLFTPLILWAAFRFDQKEVAATTVLVSAVAITGTVKGFGPFGLQPSHQALLLLQAFTGTISVMGLLVAAVVRENRRTKEILERSLEAKAGEPGASLEASAARLSEAYKQMEAFSYSVSHDLRSPLRAIRTFGDLLSKECAGQLGDDGVRYLARIQSAGDLMTRMIEDLLGFARVLTVNMEPEALDVCAMARETAAELGEENAGRRVEFRCSAKTLVRADKGLFALLLRNLLSNAWKFTAMAPEARVEIGQVKAGGSVVVFVRDNGAGFAMEDASKLFLPFQRLHDPRDFPGTGIGLATARRIVERHGGRIWAESEPGKGASFFMEFPHV